MKPDALVVADLTPAQAAKLVVSNRGNRRPVDPSTITRWIAKGAKLRCGGRIKLKAIRHPGGWLTRREWVEEFLDALTLDRSSATEPPCAAARAEAAVARMRANGF